MSGTMSKSWKATEEEVFVLRFHADHLSAPITLGDAQVKRVRYNTNRLPRLQGVECVARAWAYMKTKNAEPDKFIRELYTYKGNDKSGPVLRHRTKCVGPKAMMWHANVVQWKQPEEVTEVMEAESGVFRMPAIAVFESEGGSWVYGAYDEKNIVLVTENHESLYMSRVQFKAESDKARREREQDSCSEETVDEPDLPPPPKKSHKKKTTD